MSVKAKPAKTKDLMASVRIALLMHKAWKSAQVIYGDQYPEKIREYTALIHAAMQKHSLTNEIEAVIHLLDDIKDLDGAESATILILAACAELQKQEKQKDHA